MGDGAGQWGTHGVSIWADGVNGTAHDFTGSAYGTLTPFEQIPLHGLVALSASQTDSESEHDGCKSLKYKEALPTARDIHTLFSIPFQQTILFIKFVRQCEASCYDVSESETEPTEC